MLSTFCLVLGVAFSLGVGQVSCGRNDAGDGKCLKQHDKCQHCPADFLTTKILLSGSDKARNEVVEAQNVIIQNGEDEVVKLFSQYTLSTSLNYFCCLTDEEKKMVADMLNQNPHAVPQTITFQGVHCMESGDGNMIVFALNEQSERILKAWVNDVNIYLKDFKVVDRKDLFGLPLAVVNEDYPLDNVLQMLNSSQFDFDMTSFYVSGIIIPL